MAESAWIWRRKKATPEFRAPPQRMGPTTERRLPPTPAKGILDGRSAADIETAVEQSPTKQMNMLWLQLRSAADAMDDIEMARLILHILNATAESEEMFRPIREDICKDETRFMDAAKRMDIPLMWEIIGKHCRAMFKIRHDGWPVAECDELIAAMKRAFDAMDTDSMVDIFERVLRLCQGESRLSMRQARFREIDRAREQVVAAVGNARWEEVGAAFADMLRSLSEVRPDFEELPSLIAEANAGGVFERRADRGLALAGSVYLILRSLVNRYANPLDRGSFDRMISALRRGRADIPPDELLLFLSDAVGWAVAFRKRTQKPPIPAQRTQSGRN